MDINFEQLTKKENEKISVFLNKIIKIRKKRLITQTEAQYAYIVFLQENFKKELVFDLYTNIDLCREVKP